MSYISNRMEYLEFKIKCRDDFREILMAEMSEIGFDSFLETEEGFDAYVEAGSLNRPAVDAVFLKYEKAASVVVKEGVMPKVNWNEEWEKHYEPIDVEGRIYVRATFHPKREGFEYEIIINPKMSFGTGHHATTYLMLQLMLDSDCQGNKVMDAGSGTGILAIMAGKLGAAGVAAFDIDEWSVENGNENFELNGIKGSHMKIGTIRQVNPRGPFDIVLANINKNVLLDEMGEYAARLAPSGSLLLSGFYESDVQDLEDRAAALGLKLATKKTRDNWAAIALKRT
jgi:ribosomal protein L11 methyltransferase